MRKLLAILALLLAIGAPLLLWFLASGDLIDRMADHLFTVLSIFSGFMTAAMVMVGEHALNFSKNEQYAAGEWRRTRAIIDLYFVHSLFILSLVAILLILLSTPVRTFSCSLGLFLQLLGIGTGLFAIIISLALPSHLLKLQKKRIKQASEDHKKAYRKRLSPNS